jgi:hypothetical protein
MEYESDSKSKDPEVAQRQAAKIVQSTNLPTRPPCSQAPVFALFLILRGAPLNSVLARMM